MIIATICFILGNRARKQSKEAASYSPIVALGLFGLLVLTGMTESNNSFGDFVQAELVNLILAGIAIFGIASIAIQFGLPLYRQLVAEPRKRAEQALRAMKEKRERDVRIADSARQDKLRRKQWEVERPERERQQSLEAEKKRQAENKVQLDKERREAARAKALLSYHRHAGDIGTSFPWERFQGFMDLYLTDKLPADKVEENAEKLIETMLSFFEPEKAPVQKLSRNEIHDRFDKEREAVHAGNYCPEDREALLADIEYRERLALVNELA